MQVIPSRRQDYLLSLLSEEPVISIGELCEKLNVSHMTVRRDIALLEEQGKVISVSGGVRRASYLYEEPSWQQKTGKSVEEKNAIACSAIHRIRDGMSIYLDAGTTTFDMARRLVTMKGLSVVTNNFHISSLLIQHPHIEIFHTGGRIDHENYSAVGAKVVEFLRHVNVDIAFLSSSSWDLEHGVTTPDESKLLVKQQLMNIASRTVLVADSSKYGSVGMFHACKLEEFDTIITDHGLPHRVRSEIEERGIELDVADPESLYTTQVI